MSYRQSTIARRCAETEGRRAVHAMTMAATARLAPDIWENIAAVAARNAWRHGARALDLVGHEVDLGERRRKARR
jgi:hypothetical protein